MGGQHDSRVVNPTSFIRLFQVQVTYQSDQKKIAKCLYKFPKNDFTRKIILTPLQKLPKNLRDLGKLIEALITWPKCKKSPNPVTLIPTYKNCWDGGRGEVGDRNSAVVVVLLVESENLRARKSWFCIRSTVSLFELFKSNPNAYLNLNRPPKKQKNVEIMVLLVWPEKIAKCL